jgi:hypothetical protein
VARDHAVLVVRDVLAEVPHGAVVGLRVVVRRHLDDPPAGVADEMHHAGSDALAAPPDRAGLGQPRELEAHAQLLLAAELDDLVQRDAREERVRDDGGVRELRPHEVDATARPRGARRVGRRRAGAAHRDEDRGDGGGDRTPRAASSSRPGVGYVRHAVPPRLGVAAGTLDAPDETAVRPPGRCPARFESRPADQHTIEYDRPRQSRSSFSPSSQGRASVGIAGVVLLALCFAYLVFIVAYG